MRYRTSDGVVLSGGDSREIVRELRRISPLAPERNEMDYMRGTARRIGSGVRVDSHSHFVADLERLGYLTRVKEEPR